MRFCKTLPAWATGIPALSGMRVDLSPEGKVILAPIIPKFVFRGLRALSAGRGRTGGMARHSMDGRLRLGRRDACFPREPETRTFPVRETLRRTPGGKPFGTAIHGGSYGASNRHAEPGRPWGEKQTYGQFQAQGHHHRHHVRGHVRQLYRVHDPCHDCGHLGQVLRRGRRIHSVCRGVHAERSRRGADGYMQRRVGAADRGMEGQAGRFRTQFQDQARLHSGARGHDRRAPLWCRSARCARPSARFSPAFCSSRRLPRACCWAF